MRISTRSGGAGRASFKVEHGPLRGRPLGIFLGVGLLLGGAGLIVAGCGSDDRSFQSPACEAGETRCVGVQVERCADTGSGFEIIESCSDATPICHEGACVAQVCEPESVVCDGNSLVTCSADGTRVESEVECSGAAPICKGGACVAQACEPASLSCDGNEVITCSADGSEITRRQACDTGRQCVDGKCDNWLCKPGAQCKNDNLVEICSDDGMTLIDSVACGPAEGCVQGECKSRICMPEETYCRDGKRMVCASSGAAEDEWACGAEQSCVNDNECTNWICQPNTSYCVGSQPWSCSMDGLHTEPVGEACSGESTCQAGACTGWICTPGERRCDGNQVERCTEDGLGFEAIAECNAVQQQVCTVGACVGDGYAKYKLPTTPDNPRDYTAPAGALSVLDKVTNLRWQRSLSTEVMNWNSALNYCENLELDGRSDWRLPNRTELATLADYTSPSAQVDATVFTGAGQNKATWTSTPAFPSDGSSPSSAWVIVFGVGIQAGGSFNEAYHTRCVADEAPPSAPPAAGHFFEASSDGRTILDRATGLEWQGAELGYSGVQHEVTSYCNNLILNGAGWRVPSILELQSLVPGLKASAPRINETIFPDVKAGLYVSSTTLVQVDGGLKDYIGYLSFATGEVLHFERGISGGYALCVRTASPSP